MIKGVVAENGNPNAPRGNATGGANALAAEETSPLTSVLSRSLFFFVRRTYCNGNPIHEDFVRVRVRGDRTKKEASASHALIFQDLLITSRLAKHLTPERPTCEGNLLKRAPYFLNAAGENGTQVMPVLRQITFDVYLICDTV